MKMMTRHDLLAALWLYDMMWRIFRPGMSPVLILRARRGREDKGRMAERYARYTHRDDLPERPIWIHAVSVGESVAAVSMVNAIRKRERNIPIVITTNTTTAARRIAALPPALGVTHIYQPLDHPAFVQAFLDRLRPRLAVFLESDFWPNLIIRTATSGTPVAFASSQISDRAFERWRHMHLADDVFGVAQLVLAVDDEQARRFRSLGAHVDAVHIVGSLKLADPAPVAKDDLGRAVARAANGRRILLAASTHRGEEDTVIEAHRRLGADWFTVIAPRHPERGKEVEVRCSDAGLAFTSLSSGDAPGSGDDVFIVDELGRMQSLFAGVDIVFLGGSLVPAGGHNPVEPAAHGLAVLTGPHVFKNEAEFDALRDEGVAVDVYGARDIADAATQIAGSPKRLAAIKRKAVAHAKKASARATRAAELCLGLMASYERHGQAHADKKKTGGNRTGKGKTGKNDNRDT